MASEWERQGEGEVDSELVDYVREVDRPVGGLVFVLFPQPVQGGGADYFVSALEQTEPHVVRGASVKRRVIPVGRIIKGHPELIVGMLLSQKMATLRAPVFWRSVYVHPEYRCQMRSFKLYRALVLHRAGS
jgi:hypothetical protein